MDYRHPTKIIKILAAVVAMAFFGSKYGEVLRSFVQEEFGAKPVAMDALADYLPEGPPDDPEPPVPSCASVYCAGCGYTGMASEMCTEACTLCS